MRDEEVSMGKCSFRDKIVRDRHDAVYKANESYGVCDSESRGLHA